MALFAAMIPAYQCESSPNGRLETGRGAVKGCEKASCFACFRKPYVGVVDDAR